MTKHGKDKNTKRTPRGPSSLDVFPQKEKQKWAENLQEILNKDALFEKDIFLLRYAQTTCKFRLAVVASEDTAPFWTKINDLVKEGLLLGFTREDFLAINLVFREKAKSDLEQNYQLLKVRLDESKTKN